MPITRPRDPTLALLACVLSVILSIAAAAPAAASNGVDWQLAAAGLPTAGRTNGVAFGDLDRDGRLDLVAAMAGAGNGIRAWRNLGGAPPTWGDLAGPPLPTSGDWKAVTVADVNRDNRLDIIASGEGLGVHVFYTLGNGWAEQVLDGYTAYYDAITGDVNGDAKIDIIAARHSGSGGSGLTIWTGNGSGGFTQVSAPNAYSAVGVTVGDFDHNGLLDIATASDWAGGRVQAWIQATPGNWTDASAGLPTGSRWRKIVAADFNGDGKPDLAASGDQGVSLWSGAGSGAWVPAATGLPTTGSYTGLAAGDLDNDGRPDLVAAGALANGIGVWRNTRSGWTALTNLEPSQTWAGVALGDIDNDGVLDLAGGSGWSLGIKVWRDSGAPEPHGPWLAAASPPGSALPRALAPGDVNGDGWLDVPTATDAGLAAWAGPGANAWGACATGLPGAASLRALVAGQIWGSADPELIAGNAADGGLRAYTRDTITGAPCTWLGNQFSGLPTTGAFRSLALGHIDRDGLPELVGAREGAGLPIWQFDPATRAFSAEAASPTATGSYNDVALADLNRDGFLDIVAAGSADARGVRAWRWTDGVWTQPTMVEEFNDFAAVAVGDLNHDGLLDIIAAAKPVYALRSAAPNGSVFAWLGDGTGQNWQAFAAPDTGLFCNDLDLADYDNDGNLDLLCAGNNGLALWRLVQGSTGGWTWQAGSPGLPAQGSFVTARFAHIDHDGLLDILAGASAGGNSRLMAWTAGDGTGPAWGAFTPTGWVNASQTAPCTIQTIDGQSGLDPATAQYSFAIDGGATWSAWAAAAVSLGPLTGNLTLSANVPFGHDSALQNRVRFRAADAAGNSTTSPDFTVKVDTKPPVRPLSVDITNHTLHVWSNQPPASASWGLASDGTSGIAGYSYAWTSSGTSLPPATLMTQSTGAITTIPADGGNWWFHVRSVDVAGNWSVDAFHLGPYKLDTVPPTNPTSFNGTHQPGVWSRNPVVSISWSGATDASSGVDGYAYSFSHGTELPPTTINALGPSGTQILSDSANWNINVRTRDIAGNWSTSAKSYGSFYIDTKTPSASVSAPSSVTTTDVPLSLSGSDPSAGAFNGSGIAAYDVQVRDTTLKGNWVTWQQGISVPPGNPNTTVTFHGEDGHVYEFRALAYDRAGNMGQYPGDAQTTTRVKTIDFMVTGLEVTQAVQDLNNSVPLVQDKPTYVRFHVRMKTGNATGPVTARLRGYSLSYATSLGQILPENAGGIMTVLPVPDRGVITESFYFRLPQDWTFGSVRLMPEVNFDLRWADADFTNNTLSYDAQFTAVPPFYLWIGDACYNWNGSYHHVRTADVLSVQSWLKKAYPIGNLIVEWGGSMGCLNNPPDTDAVNSILAWVQANRTGLNYWERYVGLAINDAWLPAGFMRGSTPTAQPRLTSSSPAGPPGTIFPWDTDDDSFADWYSAHELGHALMRPHTACRGDEDKPGFYPYPGGAISPTQDHGAANALFGFDTVTEQVYGPEWTDIMSYCDNQWISDYTYKILRQRLIDEGSSSAAATGGAESVGADQDYLLVFGKIIPTTNQVTLDPFYHATMNTDRLNRTPGDYSIRLLDSGGAMLADYPFTPRVNETEAGPNGEPPAVTTAIVESVPWVAGTARVAIFHGRELLAARVVSAHAPQVTVTAPAGGQAFTGATLTVRWQGSDADGGPLTYGLFFSRDGGSSWQPLGNGLTGDSFTLETAYLAGTTQGKFRVVASDGVNQGQGDSAGVFTVPDKLPAVRITAPADGQRFVPGQLVTLEGDAFDVEDGLLGDATLTWASDISGALGSGQVLDLIDLPIGLHHITLTATDSGGNQAQASVSILVGDLGTQQTYLPLIVKTGR